MELRRDTMNTGSIFFGQHTGLFQWFYRLSAIALIIGLIFYGKENGIWTTLILFFVSMVVQSAFYVFLKLFVGGEVFLLPILVVGLILFFTVVL
ncbi:hypothetical protein [Candidatus Brocadia sapporoensis]